MEAVEISEQVSLFFLLQSEMVLRIIICHINLVSFGRGNVLLSTQFTGFVVLFQANLVRARASICNLTLLLVVCSKLHTNVAAFFEGKIVLKRPQYHALKFGT